VEYAADALPLSTQANLLSISRRSLYYLNLAPIRGSLLNLSDVDNRR
jgi:hypothetical protein